MLPKRVEKSNSADADLHKSLHWAIWHEQLIGAPDRTEVALVFSADALAGGISFGLVAW